MGIKMVDTAEPMNETGYPVARAKHIWFDDSESLQKKLDNGSLGSGGASYIELSQEEYDNLTDDERLNGKEYRIYDRGRIFKRGIEYGKDGVLIDDETTSTDTVWSSKKTSDEIADIESALGELENITTLIDFDEAIPEKGKNKIYYVNKLIGTYKCAQWRVESMYYDVSGAKQYRGVQKATSINGVDNIMLMREYYLDNNVMHWGAWTELATMDKVALKQEYFDKKVTLTDSNWKYKKLTFTKSYMNTPSVNVSCGDYLNPEFYSYWGCEAYIININNEGCTIRYRSSKASESEPLEVNIIVFVNGI